MAKPEDEIPAVDRGTPELDPPPLPLSDEAVHAARKGRAEKSHPRKVDITPAVKLDFERLKPGIEGALDEFLAERKAADLPLPDRQEMLDRAEHLLSQVDPTRLVGINSLGRNRRLVLHHKNTPPYFGMGTEGES
jgi:hypothetical protein